MALLKEESIGIKDCCRHGNAASEMQVMLKTAIGNNFMGRTRILSGFLDSNLKKLQLKVVNFKVVPP